MPTIKQLDLSEDAVDGNLFCCKDFRDKYADFFLPEPYKARVKARPFFEEEVHRMNKSIGTGDELLVDLLEELVSEELVVEF